MARTDKVDDYFASFPDDIRPLLEGIRAAIHRGAPGAKESIGYQIAKFSAAGRHPIYLGGWNQHAGIYPVPRLSEALETEVARHRSTKDTLRFKYREPIPFELIERLAGVLLLPGAATR